MANEKTKQVKSIEEMVTDYAKGIEMDPAFEGYILSPVATRVREVPINKEVSINNPIIFELENKKGQKIFIITTLDIENEELKRIGTIEKDGRLELEPDYIKKINSNVEEKTGQKDIIDSEEKTYLKDGEDGLKLDEDRMKKEKDKDEIEQGINEEEGRIKEDKFEVLAIYTLSKGAAQSVSNMCGVSLDKYDEPKMIKGKDGTCRLIAVDNGKIIEVQGRECTPIVLAMEELLRLKGGDKEIHSSEISTGKTGERGSKTDLAIFTPGGTDKESQDIIEIERDGQVKKAEIDIKTGGKEADVIGRQDYPIEDAKIVINRNGKEEVIKIREIDSREEQKPSKVKEGEVTEEERALWNSYPR